MGFLDALLNANFSLGKLLCHLCFDKITHQVLDGCLNSLLVWALLTDPLSSWGKLHVEFPRVPFRDPPRSRGSTGRTASNPMGHGQGSTGSHNVMVGRVVCLLVLAMARKVWWCLEQPKGSLLEGHVLFQRMLNLFHVSVNRVCCSLGHFGADSMKPVWVYSSTLVCSF